MIKNEILANKSKKRNLVELNGLGSSIWNDINISKYIEEQRKWD